MAVTGLLVLLTGIPAMCGYASAEIPQAPAVNGGSDKKAPDQSTDEARLTELRDKRHKTETELAAISRPDALSQGAPPDVPQEELLERQALLQHIARGYDEQLDDYQRLKEARQRHEEISNATNEWKGLPEAPPYSIFLADQLRDSIVSLRLAVEGLQSQRELIHLRSDRARDSLKSADEHLRQASERLETTKDPAEAARQRWAKDLEDLRKRAAAVTVSATETSKTRVEQELEAAQARLALAQRQLESVQPQVQFTEADLNKVRARLAQEQRDLEGDLQRIISDRHAQSQSLRDSEQQLDADSKREPKRASGNASQRLRQDKRAVERKRAQLDTLVLRGDLLKQLLDVVYSERQLWESRFALTQDGEPAKARELYARFAPLFTSFRASRDHLRQQLGIVSGQMSELDNRLRNAKDPTERDHLHALREAHQQRAAAYDRALQRVEQASRFMERWKAEFQEQRKVLPLSAKVDDWQQRAWDLMKRAWNFEVFSAEDVIEVDGKTITGRRSVTVGKIVSALIILLIGYWVCLYLARLIGRLAVTRLGLTADVANLVRQWSQAFLITILIVISLVSVKIPLTIFAFLGGAFAIGVGFGAQNLLKNVISGILVLIERPMRVGDLIEVDNVRGRVTTIGLRSSTVRDAKGMETLIPNSSFLERNLTNWTYSSHFSRFSLRLGVPYGASPHQVTTLLGELAKEHPKILKTPPPQVLLEDFGGQGYIFILNYWIEIRLDMDPNEVASELRFLIERKFTEAGLKILPGG
jgi:potassium-dependent mechanosensitive channel